MSTIVVYVYNTEATVNVSNEVISIQVNLTETKVPLNIHYGISEEEVLELLTKENITGLKLSDSPEFADAQITELATEATYAPAVWTYLANIFSDVPKSAKRHLIKVWTVLQDLAERIGLIEDKLILEYIVPLDAYSVIIDKDKHGNPLNLTGEVEICRFSIFGCNNAMSNGNTIYINDINENIYRQTYAPTYYGINSKGGYAYSNTRHNIIIANSSIFWISEIECVNDINTIPSQYRYVGHSISSLRQINSITKLEFKDGDGAALIKAGTIITIRRK